MMVWIYVLISIAAVLFIIGAVARFVRKHEGTVWWRGAMGLLAFAAILIMLQILDALRPVR
jgi:hypothetical protein